MALDRIQRELLAKHCKDHVVIEGSINMRIIAEGLISKGEITQVKSDDYEMVAYLINQDPEYSTSKRESDGHYMVFKNPNYELSESVKKTNTAVQQSFITQRRLTIYSLLLSGVSIIFIGLTALIQLYDQTPKEVQRLKLQVQKSSQSLDSIAAYLRGANSSKKIDTVYLINHFPQTKGKGK